MPYVPLLMHPGDVVGRHAVILSLPLPWMLQADVARPDFLPSHAKAGFCTCVLRQQ